MLNENAQDDNSDEVNAFRRRYDELAELSGSLAHEIKNPLSVIHMNSELLSEEISEIESPQRRRALDKVDIIREQCERMENLLRDFLRFARMEHVELTPGDLNEQLDRVLKAYQAQADQSGVEVLRYMDSDLPSVMLNSVALRVPTRSAARAPATYPALAHGSAAMVIRSPTSAGW